MTGSRPEIVQTDDGLAVQYKGRFLYNRKTPRTSAKGRIAGIDIPEKTLVFFPSPLLFYGIPDFFARLPADCHLLCVETDQQLMKLSLEHLPELLRKNPKFSLIRTESAEETARYVQSLGIWRFRRAQLITAGGGYSLYAETYKHLLERVQEEIRQFWQNRMTFIHMGHLWFKNLLYNLAEGIGGRSLPTGASISKPVCVTGAGESLEHTVPLLKELRKELFILTVDTALPVLETHGIYPDGVCVMESQFANTYDFIGAASRNAAAFLDMSSYPPLYRFFTGEQRLFCSQFGESRLLSRLAAAGLMPYSIPPLGSIGITALYIACRTTRFPVFMTGLDFAYTPGKPHARGAPSHTLLLTRCSRFSPPLAYAETAAKPIVRTEGKRPSCGSGSADEADEIRAGSRPSVPAGEEAAPFVTSDPVLLSYAETFRSLIRKEKRIYQLCPETSRCCGIANSAPQLAAAEDVRRIIAEYTCGNEDNNGAGSVQDKTESLMPAADSAASRCEKTRAFLQQEKELLYRAVRAGKYYITTSQDQASKAAVLEALAETDYIYLHFPDLPPLPSGDVGFVKRAVISGEKFLQIIEKTLRILG